MKKVQKEKEVFVPKEQVIEGFKLGIKDSSVKVGTVKEVEWTLEGIKVTFLLND